MEPNTVSIRIAARAYTCYGCDGQIDKGQRYAMKRTTLIGTKGDEEIITIGGHSHVVQTWETFDERYCEACER